MIKHIYWYVIGFSIGFIISSVLAFAEPLPKIYDDPKIYNEVTPAVLIGHPELYDGKRVIFLAEVIHYRDPVGGRMGSVFYASEFGEGCQIKLVPQEIDPKRKMYKEVCVAVVKGFDGGDFYAPDRVPGDSVLIAGVFHTFGMVRGIDYSEYVDIMGVWVK